MNKEQNICLWIGIAVFILVALTTDTIHYTGGRERYTGRRERVTGRRERVERLDRGERVGQLSPTAVSTANYGPLIARLLCVSVVTGALFITFGEAPNKSVIRSLVRGIDAMNKKQLKSMWGGILAIVLFGLPLFTVEGPAYNRLVFLVALVTGGLIYTWRDKPDKNEEDD